MGLCRLTGFAVWDWCHQCSIVGHICCNESYQPHSWMCSNDSLIQNACKVCLQSLQRVMCEVLYHSQRSGSLRTHFCMRFGGYQNATIEGLGKISLNVSSSCRTG
ncbi:hypothetical protein FKM82_021881 [Ascaphus truei]